MHFSRLLNITLRVSDGLSVHHQESKILHTSGTGVLISPHPYQEGNKLQ